MINYILQVVLFQIFFLLIYDLFLAKETFFSKNRAYLLGTLGISFLIPLVKISNFRKIVLEEEVILFPEFVLNPEKAIATIVEPAQYQESMSWLSILFWIGFLGFAILFGIKLFQIVNLVRSNDIEKNENYNLVHLNETNSAFSFFNFVFLGNRIESNHKNSILQHELVHVQEKHSLDLLIVEFLKVVMWFNPMLYFYQKRITLLHEYIADAKVSKSHQKERYINTLLSRFFQVENISFINQFYKVSLIKKRLIMISKEQSHKVKQLKYLLLVPVLLSMLFYVSCSENIYEETLTNREKSELNSKLFNAMTVEKAPTFPNCNDGDKHCFSKKVQQHFIKYFDKSLPNRLGIKNGLSRVFVQFVVNENGEVEKINVRAPHEKLKEEVASIMHSLPLMKPAESQGEKVAVKFTIPLVLKIGDYKENENSSEEVILQSEEVPFKSIDKVPTFPGCEEGDRDCFSKNVQTHIANNFDKNMLKDLGLSPGKKRIFISFKINKEGNVIDVNTRAPHEKIEKEIIRVIQALPKVKAGEMNHKKVAVKYAMPLTIFIE